MQAIASSTSCGCGPIATSTAGEQVEQPGRRVFGEQARCRDPQKASPVPGLAHLEDGPVLQSQHLRRPARQPQPTRRERDPGRRTQEQPVPELLAQLTDVERHRRLRHLEIDRGLLHRTEPHHGGESPQLGRCHRCHLVRSARPCVTNLLARRAGPRRPRSTGSSRRWRQPTAGAATPSHAGSVYKANFLGSGRSRGGDTSFSMAARWSAVVSWPAPNQCTAARCVTS